MGRKIQETGITRLTRSVLSRRAGCNIETVRYYEQIGLMPAPRRSEAGHRLYDEVNLKRLRFIRRARELGLRVNEIRNLLALVDGGDYACDEVKALALTHLGEVQRKIADLRRLQGVLKNIASRCKGGRIPDCPVIDALFEGAA